MCRSFYILVRYEIYIASQDVINCVANCDARYRLLATLNCVFRLVPADVTWNCLPMWKCLPVTGWADNHVFSNSCKLNSIISFVRGCHDCTISCCVWSLLSRNSFTLVNTVVY